MIVAKVETLDLNQGRYLFVVERVRGLKRELVYQAYVQGYDSISALRQGLANMESVFDLPEEPEPT